METGTGAEPGQWMDGPGARREWQDKGREGQQRRRERDKLSWSKTAGLTSQPVFLAMCCTPWILQQPIPPRRNVTSVRVCACAREKGGGEDGSKEKEKRRGRRVNSACEAEQMEDEGGGGERLLMTAVKESLV